MIRNSDHLILLAKVYKLSALFLVTENGCRMGNVI